jgi:hypothetical protein
MDRIKIIERSMRCYMLGWLALLPLVGLILGPMTVLLHQRVWIEAGEDWNPASRHLHAGAILGGIGFFSSVLMTWLLFMLFKKMFGS